MDVRSSAAPCTRSAKYVMDRPNERAHNRKSVGFSVIRPERRSCLDVCDHVHTAHEALGMTHLFHEVRGWDKPQPPRSPLGVQSARRCPHAFGVATIGSKWNCLLTLQNDSSGDELPSILRGTRAFTTTPRTSSCCASLSPHVSHRKENRSPHIRLSNQTLQADIFV